MPVESNELSAAAAHAVASAANEPAIASPAPSRKEHLVGLVRSLVEELSGTSLDGVEAGTSFLEIGLDSLLLTQAATLFQRKFGVAISFRQLMEDFATIDSLAKHLDEQLPAGAFAQVAAAQAPPSLCAGSGANSSVCGWRFPGSLEQMLQQQLEMTAQLLAAVRDRSRTIPPSLAVSASAPVPPAALAATPAGERRIQGPRAVPSNGSRRRRGTDGAAAAHA